MSSTQQYKDYNKGLKRQLSDGLKKAAEEAKKHTEELTIELKKANKKAIRIHRIIFLMERLGLLIAMIIIILT